MTNSLVGNRQGHRVLMGAVAALFALLLTLVAGCGSTPDTTAASPSVSAANSAFMPKSTPVSLTIPALNIKDSSLTQLGLNPDQTVEVPPVANPEQVGWYMNSPTPGEEGPAVILGHVDGNGKEGAFFNLKNLKPQDQVSVKRQDGTTVQFAVDHVDTVSKANFPSDKVYGNTTDSELRLITCGGVFDKSAHSYESNVIVYAKMVKS